MTLSEQSLDELFSNIGIDSIGFYAPSFYLSLENLARVRDVNPDKFKYGLMTYEMRIPDAGEDCISLGVKAGYNALIRGKINPKEIDALFVGTEATIYSVKSISNIYRDLLNLNPNCLTQDVANACAASSVAIINAIGMIESGIIKKALIISVDISSYDIKSPGEPTQGAGAVAMVISRNPRIAIFGKRFGKVSANINDFYRPHGERNAQVFGQYSVASYLQMQMEAYDDFTEQMGNIYTDYYIFHAPYAKLPLKFLQKLFIERGLSRIKILMKHDIPKARKFTEVDYFNELDKELLVPKYIRDKIRLFTSSEKEIKEIEVWIYQKLKRNCLTPLQVPALFGNMYSAALWAQFQYIVEFLAQPNQTIYFGSYGSGSLSVSGIMKIQPKFRSVLANPLGIMGKILEKTQKSVEEYENLRLNPREPIVKWAKLAYDHNFGLNLNFCDEGCMLSTHPGIDFCPKGHPGKNRNFYPIVATILETIPFDPLDLSPLKEGFVYLMEDAKIGGTVELDIRRWQNVHETHPKHGLLNWIPIYKVNPNSVYVDFIEQFNLETIKEKSVATSESVGL